MQIPDIVDILDNYMASQINVWAAKSNRASQIGDPCIRKLVYYRLYPELQKLHDIDLQYIFNEGNIQEQAFMRDLREAGIQIIESQRDYYDKRHNLSGHIDGQIVLPDNPRIKIPFELKSMSPHVWDQVNSVDDFDKYSWTRRYPAQLQSYMYLSNSEVGIMLLKNKSTGKPKQINFELNYDYCEELLVKCEEINQCVAIKKLPERTLSEDCQEFCPFFESCCPETQFSKIDFIDKPDLEKKIQIWEMLKDYASEYNRLDREIKSSLRSIEKAVIGDYLVQGKQLKNGWRVDIKEIIQSN
jgi:hypothetical protein